MPTYEELIAQRQELDRQINAARQEEQSKAIETVKNLIKRFELSAEECGFKQPKTGSKAKQAAPVKFRGPNGETWAGRGRTPAWLSAIESDGSSREKFRIAQ
jgi:DNA-binding protein H-NS